ncbi:hypothetical protein FO519_005261, partial [Halicephalobus sp. NKZ332]
MGGQAGGYSRDTIYDETTGGNKRGDYSSEFYPSYRDSEPKSYYPMKKAVQNLLDVRRAQFPKDAVVVDCHQPANIRTLPKIQCKLSYCQTLVLVEHERGVSFAMRGCAEHFAAINEPMLEARGDNTCKKLHSNLELQECICKNRKYCYKGSTDYKIEAASDQTPVLSSKMTMDNSPKNSTTTESKTKLFSICEIRPYLFIAGYGAISAKKVKELGITHAVDATNIINSQRVQDVEYTEVKVDDNEMTNLKP